MAWGMGKDKKHARLKIFGKPWKRVFFFSVSPCAPVQNWTEMYALSSRRFSYSFYFTAGVDVPLRLIVD